MDKPLAADSGFSFVQILTDEMKRFLWGKTPTQVD